MANQDIRSGSIIAIEKPKDYLFNPDDVDILLRCCRHCFQPCQISPIPCTGCTSILFCSTSCRQASLDGIHRYECELDLYNFRSKSSSSSFRIFLTFIAILQYPIETLEEIGTTDLMKMESHNEIRSFEEELKYVVITILILALLKNTSFSKKISSQDHNTPSYNLTDQELKIADKINHLLRVQNFNTHPILTASVGDNQASNKREFNVGLSRLGDCINVAIGSHFNHSCNPNTLRINAVAPPQTILIASRNIQRGTKREQSY